MSWYVRNRRHRRCTVRPQRRQGEENNAQRDGSTAHARTIERTIPQTALSPPPSGITALQPGPRHAARRARKLLPPRAAVEVDMRSSSANPAEWPSKRMQPGALRPRTTHASAIEIEKSRRYGAHDKRFPQNPHKRSPNEVLVPRFTRAGALYRSGMFSGAHNFTITGQPVLNNITKKYTLAPAPSDFRMFPLGDIDLHREIRLANDAGVVLRPRKSGDRRLYSAKVNSQNVTVAMYQGDGAAELLDSPDEFYRSGGRTSQHTVRSGEGIRLQRSARSSTSGVNRQIAGEYEKHITYTEMRWKAREVSKQRRQFQTKRLSPGTIGAQLLLFAGRDVPVMKLHASDDRRKVQVFGTEGPQENWRHPAPQRRTSPRKFGFDLHSVYSLKLSAVVSTLINLHHSLIPPSGAWTLVFRMRLRGKFPGTCRNSTVVLARHTVDYGAVETRRLVLPALSVVPCGRATGARYEDAAPLQHRVPLHSVWYSPLELVYPVRMRAMMIDAWRAGQGGPKTPHAPFRPAWRYRILWPAMQVPLVWLRAPIPTERSTAYQLF
ncbi:hypothetical protein DFH06DRAFT_1307591 [Mycena polygramma]|nr:hypothetical protein DFH06DRAFT_1307591 [Mycena polygramma]